MNKIDHDLLIGLSESVKEFHASHAALPPGITHDVLDAWGDRFSVTLKDLMVAQLGAFPCSEHDRRLTGLAAKLEGAQKDTQEAYLVAQVAKMEAETAKDLASGNLWKVAKIGFASMCLGAGLKLSNVAHWIIETIRHKHGGP